MHLNEDDTDTLHDVILETDVVKGEEITSEHCLTLVESAPPYLVQKAAQWGWADTEVREELGRWILDNKAKVHAFLTHV